MQLFGAAKNMASINIAPFMAGIVLNKQAWQSIPDRYKPELLRLTRKAGLEIEASLLKLENDAVTNMTRHGLKTHQITVQQQQLWYNEIQQALPKLLGNGPDKPFDRTTFSKIERILRNYRGRK
jgi:TRAP-type C4-dicarboxylate transport system substrate-binding protein